MTEAEAAKLVERLLKVFTPAQVDILIDYVGDMDEVRDAKLVELEAKVARLEQIRTLEYQTPINNSIPRFIGFGD